MAVRTAVSKSVNNSQGAIVKVVILEDHQSIVDGYIYRLQAEPRVNVVGVAAFGEQLEALVVKHRPHVVLLDLNVPAAPDNPNPYPALSLVRQPLSGEVDTYPAVLIISMHLEPFLIRQLMENGASGYILKDDAEALKSLATIVVSVARGGRSLSQQARQAVLSGAAETELSPRQLEVLALCAAYPDCSTAELAAKMNLAHSTLRTLLSNAYVRLGVHNRTAAVLKARQLGLITPFPPELKV